jgi:hypothetical protein
MPYKFSLHKISNKNKFTFDPQDYSKFKFGDDVIAEKFGIDLAKSFISSYLNLYPINKQIVVISSPYSFIPTATFAMKKYFIFELNKWLINHDLLVVQEVKINRTITYKEDYGELNAKERLNLIQNDTFQIDTEFIKDKVLIFLDDIRITGSHEIMITRMIEKYKLENDFFLLYFAELINQSIHPKIENFLNYSFVKTIKDLDKIVNGKRFFINTRIVKYLLNYEFKEFVNFIEGQNFDFIKLLFNMAVGNNYHNIHSYSENFNFLKNKLNTTNGY